MYFEDLGADLGKKVPDQNRHEDQDQVQKFPGYEGGRVILNVCLRRNYALVFHL